MGPAGVAARAAGWSPVPRAELRLLGGFELRSGGDPVAPAPNECRLLALLGINRRPLSRSYVARMLWPRVPEHQAAGRLRAALYRMRKRGPYLVVGDGRSLGLAADVVVDVRVLRRWADLTMAGNTPPAAAGVDDRQLLPDWDEDWVLLEREALRHTRLRALEALSARLTAQGRYEEAAAAGRNAVMAEPLRQSAHLGLIAAYAAAGRSDEARRQYDEYRRALRAELGLPPSPHMQRVMAGIGPSRVGDAPLTTNS